MKHFLYVLFACLLPATAVQAQQLKSQGATVEQLVPKGWEHKEALGDLNKDGIDDLVLMATPNFKEHMLTRDDGYVYNFNQPVLAIYFGTADGRYRLWKKYAEVLPHAEDEGFFVTVSLEVTNRGTLVIGTELFASMGSYGNDQSSYVYRYQNGDFYLIGMENESMQRNTGEIEKVSENYLTWKRQVVKDNAFEEGKSREKWTTLPKKPLEKLGDRKLD
jgi:uncharacterized membrane protein